MSTERLLAVGWSVLLALFFGGGLAAGMPCVLIGKLRLVILLDSSNLAVTVPVERNDSLLVRRDSVGVHLRIKSREFDSLGRNAVLRKTIKEPSLHLRSNMEMNQSLRVVCRLPGKNVEVDRSRR